MSNISPTTQTQPKKGNKRRRTANCSKPEVVYLIDLINVDNECLASWTDSSSEGKPYETTLTLIHPRTGKRVPVKLSMRLDEYNGLKLLYLSSMFDKNKIVLLGEMGDFSQEADFVTSVKNEMAETFLCEQCHFFDNCSLPHWKDGKWMCADCFASMAFKVHNPENCSICLEPMQYSMHPFSCGHSIHADCWKKMKQTTSVQNRKCPLCRSRP